MTPAQRQIILGIVLFIAALAVPFAGQWLAFNSPPWLADADADGWLVGNPIIFFPLLILFSVLFSCGAYNFFDGLDNRDKEKREDRKRWEEYERLKRDER